MSLIPYWTVDYGNGPTPVKVPHAWRQDVSVKWEGPAIYRTRVEVPACGAWIVFQGVSYAATVRVERLLVKEHRGIWDAFAVDLTSWSGSEVEVEVEVVKNGGASYPVKDVASGFLPYVFNTFGGIFREVELHSGSSNPLSSLPPAPDSRVTVHGSKLHVDGEPYYMRGVLTWGWYPELGHQNPDDSTIRSEVQAAIDLGFNLIKFCLWIPPHRYLEIMDELGLMAWIELPLWDPSPDLTKLDAIAQELERIVIQYRRHSNIIVWTVGCELSTSTPPEYRQRLVEMVQRRTGCPLVKDNSGGAEMYGGDLREFGDFDDFHPYCDTPFYPIVLDSLLPGPRPARPLFLGEFNDIDAHRDLAALRSKAPYWTSTDPDLNDVGVRWQHDLPQVLNTSRFALDPIGSDSASLVESSCTKATFIRRTVQEAVRARSDISGYVITGWRDTPISTSGFVGDDGCVVRRTGDWNQPAMLFPIPDRGPPWVRGGNRPGWIDPWNRFPGQFHLRIGLHSESAMDGRAHWSIRRADGGEIAKGTGEWLGIEPLEATQVVEIHADLARCGAYVLEVWFDRVSAEWPIWIVPSIDWGTVDGWRKDDPQDRFEGCLAGEGPSLISTRLSRSATDAQRAILMPSTLGTIGAPFWRECAYQFSPYESPAGQAIAAVKDQWHRLYPLSSDRVLDPIALHDAFPSIQFRTLMTRIDTRTYAEHPVLVESDDGRLIVTTLRPDGGYGVNPLGLRRNPAGSEFLRLAMGIQLTG